MKRLIIALALISLAAKHPTAPAWTAKYSSGVTLKPNAQGFTFDFPSQRGHVNYVMRPASGQMSQAQSLTMTVRVDVLSGAPVFNYLLQPDNVCINYASVRAHIVGKVTSGKQWDEASLSGYYRWWSNPINIELKPGTWTATTPLTPDQWTDTSGYRGDLDIYGFDFYRWSISHPHEIGMTFGGGCFFGHGVSVGNGTARFELLDYKVIP